MNIKQLLIVLLLLIPFTASAQEMSADKESESVKQVVQDYLDHKSPETTQKALYAKAKIFSIKVGGGEVTENVISKSSKAIPGATTIEPSQRIIAVDVAQDGAMVKVESTFPANAPGRMPQPHFQYLSLLKLNGKWKIVSILMPPLQYQDKN